MRGTQESEQPEPALKIAGVSPRRDLANLTLHEALRCACYSAVSDGILPVFRIFVVVDRAADCGACPFRPKAPGLVLDVGDHVSLGGSAGLHCGGSHSG